MNGYHSPSWTLRGAKGQGTETLDTVAYRAKKKVLRHRFERGPWATIMTTVYPWRPGEYEAEAYWKRQYEQSSRGRG